MELLRAYGVELRGRRAVVLGRSAIVGTPMALLLLRADASVQACAHPVECKARRNMRRPPPPFLLFPLRASLPYFLGTCGAVV